MKRHNAVAPITPVSTSGGAIEEMKPGARNTSDADDGELPALVDPTG